MGINKQEKKKKFEKKLNLMILDRILNNNINQKLVKTISDDCILVKFLSLETFFISSHNTKF